MKELFMAVGIVTIALTVTGFISIGYTIVFPSTKDPSTLWNVYEDQDNGVTCYIYDEKSISCLPTKDLKTNQ